MKVDASWFGTTAKFIFAWNVGLDLPAMQTNRMSRSLTTLLHLRPIEPDLWHFSTPNGGQQFT